MSESLAINTSMTYEAKLVGKKGDDDFPCNGKISKIELNKTVSAISITKLDPGVGRGDAKYTQKNSSTVGVHYWLDPGTKLTYNLKVWVRD
ncbi:hypothetical protein [Roseofilum sp. Guam]|uniref:hypothetical protein n=1 Tax=Roseofilum sp. Guam TaxID=2821502 RepID=UPI001B1216C9|nr:hypothetical protein [Roseofilum sp. Guam]MBP0028176.1 hypothetical protein [Roseofilum sp. Guam]